MKKKGKKICKILIFLTFFLNFFLSILKLSPKGFKNQRSNIQKTQWPFVYSRCGHVHSDHSWDDQNVPASEEEKNGRTCPICRQKSKLIQLDLGLEPAFLQDYKKVQHSTNTILKKRREGLDSQSEEEYQLLSHCFVPCGHVTTSRTANYWSTEIRIPKGTMNFERLCPFCLGKLDEKNPICRLIFQ